ncbi:sugar phosphate isomerase/epimerase family protein [Peribacillus simplex]|uniref:sugar phosphate isomerase/epimerase family protein n=1 Tax=Peribacillus simplex TaxID=1478 RepID=UPI003B8C8ED5
MKFSICSWIFGDMPIDKIMRFVSGTGYDAIEIRAAVNDYDWKDILHLSKELSLEIGGLTGDSAWPNQAHDLANAHIENRRKAIDYFKRQMEAVKAVEGKYLVVCPSAVGKTSPMGLNGDDWKWAVDSVQELVGKACELNITLVIEPLNRYESCLVNSGEDALRFVQEVGSPKVRMLLDSYHMNIEEVDLETPFLKTKEYLEIVHVADSNRQALGRGHIDFGKITSGINRSGFNGHIVVECMAPGADPFQASKGYPAIDLIYTYAEESLLYLKELSMDRR